MSFSDICFTIILLLVIAIVEGINRLTSEDRVSVLIVNDSVYDLIRNIILISTKKSISFYGKIPLPDKKKTAVCMATVFLYLSKQL